MLTAALWDRIDGFDPGYFLYWEDVDLSHRVRAAGGRLEVVADATAVHAEGGTQSTDGRRRARSPGGAEVVRYYYYNIRNRLLFASRAPARFRPARLAARATLRVSWEILLQGGRRQFLRSAAPLVAGWRGVRDGRRLVREELRRRSEQPLVGGQPAVERR